MLTVFSKKKVVKRQMAQLSINNKRFQCHFTFLQAIGMFAKKDQEEIPLERRKKIG